MGFTEIIFKNKITKQWTLGMADVWILAQHSRNGQNPFFRLLWTIKPITWAKNWLKGHKKEVH